MKIWTGKTCRLLHALTIVVSALWLSSCTSSDKKEKSAASASEINSDYRSSEDRKAIEALRKEIPEEIRKSNDRLAESLKRWKVIKTPPETLRGKFNDEIAKMRREHDKRWRRMREDFQRGQKDKREGSIAKQKETRESFLKSKPVSQKRQDFFNKQGIERDRMNADLRDERSDFDEKLKDERKKFEDEIASRWVEFRQEYPEYTRNYNEMKKEEELKREENKGKPYQGWPYKDENAAPTTGNIDDNNKGGQGWPTTDPADFDKMPGKSKKGP